MKLTKYAWMLWSVALIVVLVFAFVIPFTQSEVYWLALGCTAGMFGVCAVSFARAFRRDKSLESKLLGWPIFKVGYMAAVIQIIVGFALMGVSALCPLWIAILVEVLVYAATAFCFVARDAARETVIQMETIIPDATAPWKAIRARANAIAAESGNAEIRKLADDIRYADPMPTALDGEIATLLNDISANVDVEKIHRLFALVKNRRSIGSNTK